MVVEEMTEKKRYTSKEINEKTNKYFENFFIQLFKNDKISFADFNLVKSVITDIQLLFGDD